jgi:hypothetical protein
LKNKLIVALGATEHLSLEEAVKLAYERLAKPFSTNPYSNSNASASNTIATAPTYRDHSPKSFNNIGGQYPLESTPVQQNTLA